MKIKKPSIQYAIDLFKDVAIYRNGAIAGLYSGFINRARCSISPLIESNQPVPVMFCCKSELGRWAHANRMGIGQIGEISQDDAVRLMPLDKPTKTSMPPIMYWVRAQSDLYRSVMIEWYKHEHGVGCVKKAHEEALEIFKAAAKEIRKKPTTFRKFSANKKKRVLAAIYEAIRENRDALNKGVDNEKAAFTLLGTLDADHVMNRASLSRFSGAWVLLFPVPADANRGFGRRVERFRGKIDPTVNRIDLSPETAFKLFTSAMPRNLSELEFAMRNIKGQLNNEKFTRQMEDVIKSHLQGSFGQV